jgi:hypothetical protein
LDKNKNQICKENSSCAPFGWCQTKEADGGFWFDEEIYGLVTEEGKSLDDMKEKYEKHAVFGCPAKTNNGDKACKKDGNCRWTENKCVTKQICGNNTTPDDCLDSGIGLQICSWDGDAVNGVCKPNGFKDKRLAEPNCKAQWKDNKLQDLEKDECEGWWRCAWDSEEKTCGVAPKPKCDSDKVKELCKDVEDVDKCVDNLHKKELCYKECKTELKLGADAFTAREGRKRCSKWWTPQDEKFREECAAECGELKKKEDGKCLADEDCGSEDMKVCMFHTGTCESYVKATHGECTYKGIGPCDLQKGYCCSQWSCGSEDGHCHKDKGGEEIRKKLLKGDSNGAAYLEEARRQKLKNAAIEGILNAIKEETRWNITAWNKCGDLLPKKHFGKNAFEICNPAGEAPCCSPYGWCQSKKDKDDELSYWCGTAPNSVMSIEDEDIDKNNEQYKKAFACHIIFAEGECNGNEEAACTWKDGKCVTSQICANNTTEETCLRIENKLEICSWQEKICKPNGYVDEKQAGTDCSNKYDMEKCKNVWRCQWNQEEGEKKGKCTLAQIKTCEKAREDSNTKVFDYPVSWPATLVQRRKSYQ